MYHHSIIIQSKRLPIIERSSSHYDELNQASRFMQSLRPVSHLKDFIIIIISYSCRWRYCTGILHYQCNKVGFLALAMLLSLSLFINHHHHFLSLMMTIYFQNHTFSIFSSLECIWKAFHYRQRILIFALIETMTQFMNSFSTLEIQYPFASFQLTCNKLSSNVDLIK